MKGLLPGLLLPALLYSYQSFQAFQTDWSSGPGVPGPVFYWDESFESHLRFSYEDMPGELFLNLQVGKHQVTDDLEYAVPGAVADINGDGHLDILGCSMGYGSSSVSWFENDGSGGGWERHEVSGWGEIYALRHSCTADVDGDGDMDVLGAEGSTTWDRIYLWINTDGTGLTWETSIIADNMATSPTLLVPADVDGDSDPDVIVRRSGPGSMILWFENPMTDLSATDEWTQHFVGMKAAAGLSVGDVNGDGDLDILTASEGSNHQLSWWEDENGTGDNWVEHVILNNYGNARAVHAVDMDGDGDLDVIAAGFDMLCWLENTNGSGLSWAQHPIPDPFVSCNQIVGVDLFENDNPVILCVYGNSGGSRRFVLRERMDEGALTWRMHILEKGFWYSGLVVEDIDGDDTLDAVTFEHGSRIFWSSLGYPDMGWLTSSIVDANNYPHWDELQWEDSVPSGSFLGFRVRSSNDPADMGEWSGYIEEPGSLEGYVDSTHRYLQYRVVMESGGRFITPSLDEVIFFWDWLGVEGTEDATRLHPVTPNPLYGPVELRFSLAEPGPVTIRVFDLCGRVVASPVAGEVSGGEHSVQLASLPPGAYFVRMTAGENVLRERFVLVGER